MVILMKHMFKLTRKTLKKGRLHIIKRHNYQIVKILILTYF